MNRVITFENRSHYGRDCMYITSEHAEYVNALTGKKTIDRYDIENLRSLGFTVTTVPSQDGLNHFIPSKN